MAALSAPFYGPVIDRVGARPAALVCIVAFALGLLAVSLSPAALPVFGLAVVAAGITGQGHSGLATPGS